MKSSRSAGRAGYQSLALYIAASAFLLWHTLTLFAVPALAFFPNQRFEAFFQRYVELTRIKSAWSFFAPDVNLGSVLEYRAGNGVGREVVNLTRRLDKWDPAYFRYAVFFVRVLAGMEAERTEKLTSLAQYLCGQHAALRPRWIIFTPRLQKRFEPEAFLRGKHPLDAEFLKELPQAQISCPAGAST